MFRLAHLTDLHIGPLPPVRLTELFSKRATGWANWHSGRHRRHDRAVLNALAADMIAHAPDHIACTGDISNLGLAAEWPVARRFLEKLGAPEQVSFIPGNHDAYTRSSLAGLFAACGAYMHGDGETNIRFPYLRRRGRVALIGLNSAIPTGPFKAYGRLGPAQLEALETLLTALRDEGPICRVIMIHHPPHVGGTTPSRELKDAAALEAVLARAGAELVLYGHNHVTAFDWCAGPHGPIPLIAAPSASASKRDADHRAAWNLYEISESAHGFAIALERHGIGEVLERRPLVL